MNICDEGFSSTAYTTGQGAGQLASRSRGNGEREREPYCARGRLRVRVPSGCSRHSEGSDVAGTKGELGRAQSLLPSANTAAFPTFAHRRSPTHTT